MCTGKYANVSLTEVLNFLIHYTDSESAKRMCKDCSPGPEYMESCDRVYELYEKIRESESQEHFNW